MSDSQPTCLLFLLDVKGQFARVAQILDSDDEEEKRSSSESPLLSRPLQSKRPAQIIEDDSDDDFAAPVKPTGKAGGAFDCWGCTVGCVSFHSGPGHVSTRLSDVN